MPTAGRPTTAIERARPSGVLRNTFTYDVPKARSGAIGDTRIAASTVPITMASSPDKASSRSVTRKPSSSRSTNSDG